MSRQGIIFSKIWSDDKFKSLSTNEKVMFLYCLSSPHLNKMGYFYLPMDYISCDTQFSKEDCEQLLASLLVKGLVAYDYTENVILVKNYLKYNPIGKTSTDINRINKDLKDMPKSYLIHDFIEVLKENSSFGEDGIRAILSFPVVKESMKIEVPQKKVPFAVIVPEQKPVEATAKRGGRKKKTGLTEEERIFEEFWKQYPRRVSKGTAFKRFWDIIREGQFTANQLIQSAFNYAQYCAQNQTAEKYIQHPSTFLGKQKQTYLSFVYKPEYPALFEDSNQPFLSSDGKFIHHDPKMVNAVNKPKTTPLKTSFSAEQLLNIG